MWRSEALIFVISSSSWRSETIFPPPELLVVVIGRRLLENLFGGRNAFLELDEPVRTQREHSFRDGLLLDIAGRRAVQHLVLDLRAHRHHLVDADASLVAGVAALHASLAFLEALLARGVLG